MDDLITHENYEVLMQSPHPVDNWVYNLITYDGNDRQILVIDEIGDLKSTYNGKNSEICDLWFRLTQIDSQVLFPLDTIDL